MIDLRKRNLPNAIECGGKFFSIKTDFREWLKFGELIKTDRTLKDYVFLFKNEVPNIDFFKQLIDFYINKNCTPNIKDSKSDLNILDYLEDGEYIYASFLEAYGIDLLEEDLHWHKFQALIRSLPETSKMQRIMSARAYKPTKKSMESQLQEARDMWALPYNSKKTDEELMHELMEEFYGTI